MYIYNVTIKIENAIEEKWLEWMKEEHLQEVVDTGMFDSYHFLELVEDEDDGTKTYIAQYMTDSENRYNRYIKEFAPKLREKGYAKFGNQFIAFRTILKKHI